MQSLGKAVLAKEIKVQSSRIKSRTPGRQDAKNMNSQCLFALSAPSPPLRENNARNDARNKKYGFFPRFRTQDPYCFVILPIREGLHPSLLDGAPLGLQVPKSEHNASQLKHLPLLKEKVGERCPIPFPIHHSSFKIRYSSFPNLPTLNSKSPLRGSRSTTKPHLYNQNATLWLSFPKSDQRFLQLRCSPSPRGEGMGEVVNPLNSTKYFIRSRDGNESPPVRPSLTSGIDEWFRYFG